MSNISDYIETFTGELVPPRDIWLLSDTLIQYVEIINFVFICGVLSLFGIVTNIFNLMVFLRIGFKETINISLFALAISDICSLITLLWVSICYNPFLLSPNINVLFISLEHYTGTWPHVMFIRITGFITIFITIERCLCIVFPLKIKDMITPKRVTLTLIAIYVIIICSMTPNFFTFRIGWHWVPEYNRSMFGIYYPSDSFSRRIELASQYVQTIYIGLSFVLITICTIVFIWKLNQRGKWRQAAASVKDNVATSARDQRIVKMVIVVAVIFFLSYIPSLLLVIAFAISSDIDIDGKYRNLCILLLSCTSPAEAMNSSVNIFIYYRMMSKYQNTFRSIICKGTKLIEK